MNFESGGIYHIYNQGNNRQRLFYNRENYLFFIRKMRHHILPFTDVLAWCLMPNHFHLMVEVKDVVLPVIIEGVTSNHPFNKKRLTLNSSIGIMLRSYTRAVNIQEDRTGGLFREETKAICLNGFNGLLPNWYTSFGVTFLNVEIPEFQYPQVCFNYIHANPVKSGLVKKQEDWEFSSYKDLKGLRDGSLVNRGKVKDLGLIIK